MAYTVQKSFWGKKIVNENDEKYKLKSPYKIKFDEDNSFKFYHNGKPVTPSIVEFVYKDASIIARTVNGTTILIDPYLCFISPEFISRDENIIVDKNNNILLMNQDNFSTTPTGYKAPEQKHSGYTKYNETCAVDENGKFGVISTKTGKAVCPFVFDSPNISYSFNSVDRNKSVYTYYDDNNFITLNIYGQVIMQGDVKDMPKPMSKYGYFKSCDPITNTSKIYTYNQKENKLVELGNYTGYVRDALNIGDNYYIISSDDNKQITLYNQNNEKYLDNTYDEIYFKQIDSNRKYGKDVDIIVIEKNGLLGIYIPETNQLIEPQYKEIDFQDCGKTEDGTYKFLVRNGDYWGVVNGNNEVEVPFEYKNEPNCKAHYENDNNNYLLEIKDKNGDSRYLSVFEENIIADAETTENINNYRARRTRRYQEEQQRKNQQKSKTSERHSRYTEEERATAAIGATLVTGSPVAGLIVNELMKD